MMRKSKALLRESESLPIDWLSEGKLRLSLLLRHTKNRPQPGTEGAILNLLTQEPVPAKAVSSILPQIGEPSRDTLTRASEDYTRCVLAKAISEVYRKVTPKYRNEAARKQFFKRLAEIAESVHLSEPADKLHEVLSFTATDDAAIWIQTEFERLVAQRIDLGDEHRVKLISARNEFRSDMKRLEELVGITWQDSDRYHRSLSIISFFPPDLNESKDTWRWGAQWFADIGVLNVNPPILFFDALRKGVLAREATILLSPANMDRIAQEPFALCEQAEYLAYRLFEHKNDKELWSEARHGLRQKSRFRPNELIEFFQFYEMMVGDSLYGELWLRLKEFGSAQPTFADYLTIFNSLSSRPTNPKFDKSELDLLNLLSKKPDVGAGEAARLLGVSIPTAMKAIRMLSTKAGLRFTVLVDMQKIGLVEHLMLISTTKQSEAVRTFARFPYCRQVFRTYGSSDLFCVWDIPQEHRDFSRAFLQRMVDTGHISEFQLLELEKDLQAVNFDTYDAKSGRWDIHWDSWGVSLRESLGKSESFGMNYSSQSVPFPVDKVDLNVLSHLQVDCRTPFSAIARMLGLSGAYIGRRVSRMLKSGLFRYAVWPLKIGAEEWGLIALSCKRNVADTLAQYLSKLPAWRGGLVVGDFEGLLAIVWCPNGELKQLFKAIDDRLVKTDMAQAKCMSSTGEWLMGRWLPVDPDDPWNLFSDDGRWLFDENRYMALVQ